MKLSLRSKASFIAFLAGAFILMVHPSGAQTITVVQDLSFGKIAIVGSGGVARVTIETNGTATTNGNAYFLEQPTRGEYQIIGGPPDTIYTVTLPPSINLTGPGSVFTMDNFEVRPMTLITNAAGDATFYITARLQTQGGGATYYDGDYSSLFAIIVAF